MIARSVGGKLFWWGGGRRGNRARRPWRSFTLTELMVVVSIITIMATTVLVATYQVIEDAKEARTRAQIAKLHQLIMEKWDSFRTRPVALSLPANMNPRFIATRRLAALRELMRMELPDRITDLGDPPVSGIRPTALYRAYRRRVASAVGANWYQPSQPVGGGTGCWSYLHEGAEALYLIVANIRDGEKRALDYFQPSEIGDTDGDGMLEILDAWGRPIEFLRWAPGFVTNPGRDGGWGDFGVDDDGNGVVDDFREAGWPETDDSSEIQIRDAQSAPDPFDPLKVDPRWSDASARNDPFALYPLIFSAGRDGVYAVDVDFDTQPGTPPMDLFRYADASLAIPNDPYTVIPVSPRRMFGRVTEGAIDNITNHFLSER